MVMKMASKMLGEAPISQPEHIKGEARVGEELEEYDCGCKIQFRKVDYGEAKDELPRKSLTVPEYLPCARHKGVESPPRDSRLIKVRREYESFLNE